VLQIGSAPPRIRSMLTTRSLSCFDILHFTIPSTLKAWIDNVARAGRTFSYSEAGPKGLVIGKQVIIVGARGGVYSEAAKPFDFQIPYLRSVLGFLGMTDVEVLEIDGTAYGPEAAEKNRPTWPSA